MEKLFETIIGKISRYEIITNLIPGTLLLFILSLIGFDILFDNVVLNIISSYYVGLVNNRFSSLCIEGVMRKFKWVEWRDYNKYNKAKADYENVYANADEATRAKLDGLMRSS